MRSRAGAAAASHSKEVRCAIYTRKSSEEGLEQEFNSLHAQREACQAYILSQRHEGWRALPALYDDGGISGGTMLRPALQRLLDDIRARRIDLIVIYKVDRLTRSLADFAKLVDVFNAHDVSFVSVTQQFNTATSMGRLTLNMLLSFAQFEREVTGERIRDKIAASKRKGMWMGGYPPLGYDVQDRKLVVNTAEAAQVGRIFRLYAELGSVRLLQDRLSVEGITSKQRHSGTGRISGGLSLQRGNLYGMLQNRLYRGEVAHRGQVYPGEHEAIVDEALWDRVQDGLLSRRTDRPSGSSGDQPALLTGLVFDGDGERLTPSHAKKGAKRYRYYVSARLVTRARGSAVDGLRLPAGGLDGLVTQALLDLIAAPAALLDALGATACSASQQQVLLVAAGELAGAWAQLEHARLRDMVRAVVARVSVHADAVRVDVDVQQLRAQLQGDAAPLTSADRAQAASCCHTITVPAALRRAGKEMRLVIAGPRPASSPDAILAKLVCQAVAFRDRLLTANGLGIAELAADAGVSGSHYTRVLRLGFLSPEILTAIADGQQPVGLTATKLLADTRLALLWSEQKVILRF